VLGRVTRIFHVPYPFSGAALCYHVGYIGVSRVTEDIQPSYHHFHLSQCFSSEAVGGRNICAPARCIRKNAVKMEVR